MSDEDRDVPDTEANDDAVEDVDPPTDLPAVDGPPHRRKDRTRRHLVVLAVAVVGLAIGGALVISGRPSSSDPRAKRTTPSTIAAGDLLPSLGVVPDVAAAKVLLARLDPRSLRPDPNATTAKRELTTTPSQALFMMNDEFLHQRSAAYARRLLAEFPDERELLARVHQEAYSRNPTSGEIDAAQRFRRGYEERSPDDGNRAVASLAAYLRVILSSNEFLYLN